MLKKDRLYCVPTCGGGFATGFLTDQGQFAASGRLFETRREAALAGPQDVLHQTNLTVSRRDPASALFFDVGAVQNRTDLVVPEVPKTGTIMSPASWVDHDLEIREPSELRRPTSWPLASAPRPARKPNHGVSDLAGLQFGLAPKLEAEVVLMVEACDIWTRDELCRTEELESRLIQVLRLRSRRSSWVREFSGSYLALEELLQAAIQLSSFLSGSIAPTHPRLYVDFVSEDASPDVTEVFEKEGLLGGGETWACLLEAVMATQPDDSGGVRLDPEASCLRVWCEDTSAQEAIQVLKTQLMADASTVKALIAVARRSGVIE